MIWAGFAVAAALGTLLLCRVAQHAAEQAELHATRAEWHAERAEATVARMQSRMQCRHDWLRRGGPGDEWCECYLCGKQEAQP